jgi:transposase InsO family protein
MTEANSKARIEQAARPVLGLAPPAGPEEPKPSLPAIDGAAKARADAKAWLLAEALRLQADKGLSLSAASKAFAAAYNKGKVSAPPDVRGLVKKLGRDTIATWAEVVRKEGTGRLAGAYGNRRGATLIDTQPEVMELVLGMLANRPHCRPAHVFEALRGHLGSRDDIRLPSQDAIWRWLEAYKAEHAEGFTAHSNPDRWKSRYMVAFGAADDGIVRLNQRWELDSSPADVMLAEGRYSLLGLLDVWSRRGKLLVRPTSSAAGIGGLLRRGILDWGVPELAKTDNGKDYTSRQLVRFFLDLGIEQVLCPPYSPWHKPFVERFFKTFAHDLLELLPGYVGHDVAERQELRDRQSFAERLMQPKQVVELRMSAAELQTFCDQWTDSIYAHRPHDGLAGQTPWQRAQSWTQPVRRVESERALDLLLAEPAKGGSRKVLKQGLHIEGAWFVAAELGGLAGRQVHVRLDPLDQGRVHVFDEKGCFVCLATAEDRLGADRAEVARKAKQIQLERVASERKALRQAAKKVDVDEVVAEVLREAAVAAGKLVALPRASVPHQTEGLTAAGECAKALDDADVAELATPPVVALAPEPPKNVVPANVLEQRRAKVEREEPRPLVRPIFRTPWQRANWAAEQERLGRCPGEDAAFLATWRAENPAKARELEADIVARYGHAKQSEVGT